jgi:DNA-binding CsgD family transcriptional regulator
MHLGRTPFAVEIAPTLEVRDLDRLSDIGMPDPAALLFIVDPSNRKEIPLEWIMDSYRLTPAEAKVAIAAAQGGSIGDMASNLNLSTNTIKTHLRHAFTKTHTRRQAELARLMASLGSVAGNRDEDR